VALVGVECISPSGKAPIGLPSSRMFEISITAG